MQAVAYNIASIHSFHDDTHSLWLAGARLCHSPHARLTRAPPKGICPLRCRACQVRTAAGPSTEQLVIVTPLKVTVMAVAARWSPSTYTAPA